MCSRFQPEKKACDGRCQKSAGCKSKPLRRWIIAACGGSISILEQLAQRVAARAGDDAMFATPAAFSDYLRTAGLRGEFDQLVAVGSANDVAWLCAIIPAELSNHVVAEITYPLMPEWFREPGQVQLSEAITPLMP